MCRLDDLTVSTAAAMRVPLGLRELSTLGTEISALFCAQRISPTTTTRHARHLRLSCQATPVVGY
jgi:hypothetical protein